MERKFIIITILQHIGEQVINNFMHLASTLVLRRILYPLPRLPSQLYITPESHHSRRRSATRIHNKRNSRIYLSDE